MNSIKETPVNPPTKLESGLNRRQMIQKTAASALAIAAAHSLSTPVWAEGQSAPGVTATGAPSGQVFDPRRFGAVGDGVTLDTAAIQRAIDACTQAGGGTVHLSPGTYYSGTINIKSNVALEIGAGATILGSANPNDYVLPPDASAALKGAQGKHLIFSYNAQNISLRGPGTVDGNSSKYYTQVNRPPVAPDQQYKDVVAFGWKRSIGISPMIQLANTNNVVVENIRLQNAVGWTLQPVGCNQVLIRKVTVRNPIYSSNADGIDPTSCQNVLVTDCDIITGDDAICVKSYNPYKPYDTGQICANVTVTNCRVSTCCNGLKVGIEGPNAFHNISFSNCTVYGDPSRPVNEWPISGIAVEEAGGSTIDGVTYDGITMTNVRTPIFIRLQKVMGAAATAPAKGGLQNVTISNVNATGAILTSSITGLQSLPVQNIVLKNINISTDEQGRPEWTQAPVKEAETNYVEANQFGRLPSYGFYARHVVNLKMENINVATTKGDPRPMFIHDDTH
jgi:polygalacturonase